MTVRLLIFYKKRKFVCLLFNLKNKKTKIKIPVDKQNNENCV